MFWILVLHLQFKCKLATKWESWSLIEIEKINASTHYNYVSFLFFYFSIKKITLSLFPLTQNLIRYQQIWQQKAFSQNKWMFGQAQIYLAPSYTVAFEAIIERNETTTTTTMESSWRDASDEAFVALDDIMIIDGPCKTVDYCSFDQKHLCTYKNLLTDFNWLIGSSTKNGLNHDVHTYIYSVALYFIDKNKRCLWYTTDDH